MYGYLLASAAATLFASGAAVLSEPLRISSPAYEEGALERSDERSNSRFRDQYLLYGRAGDQLDIDASGYDIKLTAVIVGPGLRLASDPELAWDAELEVTLPRDGAYLISVTSVDANTTGGYRLSVMASCRPPAYLNAEGSCVRP